jgi:putative Holliday junction resolvase
VAVSDRAQTLAFPRDAIDAGEGAVAALRALINDEDVEIVVVGRPTSLQGRETDSTRVADRLLDDLAGSVGGVRFVTFDERLTTTSAKRNLRSAGRSERQQRSIIDSEAATVILQGYLDASRP